MVEIALDAPTQAELQRFLDEHADVLVDGGWDRLASLRFALHAHTAIPPEHPVNAEPSYLKPETLVCQYDCGCTTDVDVDQRSGYAYNIETGEYLADLRNQTYVCDVVEHGCFGRVLEANLKSYGHQRGRDHPKAKLWFCQEHNFAPLEFAEKPIARWRHAIWDASGRAVPSHCGYHAVLAHQDIVPDGPIWIPDFSRPLA